MTKFGGDIVKETPEETPNLDHLQRKITISIHAEGPDADQLNPVVWLMEDIRSLGYDVTITHSTINVYYTTEEKKKNVSSDNSVKSISGKDDKQSKTK